MAEVVERVDALEAALMKLVYAQFNTEMELQKFSREMGEFKAEMKDFKDEMKEFKEEMRVFKDEMSAFKEETRQANRAMNKRWGEVVNKWGSIVEDIVHPNVPRLAAEHFGAVDPELIAARVNRPRLGKSSALREFDVVMAWPGAFLLVEVKATLRAEYFRDFVTFIEEERVFDYFPEYRGRHLIPVFASFHIPPSDVAYLSRHRIYAMGMGEDTMDLLNFGAFPAT